MKREGNLKTTYNFLRKARLPWVHFVISSIVPFLSTYIYVYLPELEGRIAAGEIFDKGLIREYVFFSAVLLALNLASFYTAWVEIQFDRRVQKFTWSNLIAMPMRRFEMQQPSELISRITDDSTYVSMFINYIISVVTAIYSAVLMILSLFRSSAVLAAFIIPVMILNILFAFFAQSRGYDVGYSIQSAISRYTSFLSERVHRVDVIKAAGAEEEESRRGRKLSDERRKEEMRAQWYEIVISITMEITNILIVGIILIFGALMVKDGSLRMSSLITFYMLATALPNTLQELLFQILKMQQFRGAIQVIAGLAEETGENTKGGRKIEPLENAIEFKNVSFQYADDGRKVLDGMSFSIPKGSTTAIVGPTGSGKTTILKLLERFYPVEYGDILYDGRSIGEYDIHSWRRHFGYIVQNSPLISGTIRSNICYGAKRKLSDDEIMDIAAAVKLDGFINGLEKGLDTPIEGNGENISGGQRQRIATARAIAAEPEILIMDEATSNLDPVNAKEINQALQDLMKERTVIVVAHQMNTIRNADQILVIDQGKVQETGDHESLKDAEGYYSRYLRLQEL